MLFNASVGLGAIQRMNPALSHINRQVDIQMLINEAKPVLNEHVLSVITQVIAAIID